MNKSQSDLSDDPADRSTNIPLNQKIGFFTSLKAVAWSFVGLRSSNGTKHDIRHANPIHLILAGILLVGCMILSLVSLVQFILR